MHIQQQTKGNQEMGRGLTATGGEGRHFYSSQSRVKLGSGQGQRGHSFLGGIQHLKDCDDDPKEANGTAKDLHDENLYKEAGVLCIS